jgi:hypothetical protein
MRDVFVDGTQIGNRIYRLGMVPVGRLIFSSIVKVSI